MRTSAWTGPSLTLFCYTWLALMCFSFVTCFPQLLPLLFLCLQLWLMIFTSRVMEAIFDANSIAFAEGKKKYLKIQKTSSWPLACRRSVKTGFPWTLWDESQCCSGRGLHCWFCMWLHSQCILTSPCAAQSRHWSRGTGKHGSDAFLRLCYPAGDVFYVPVAFVQVQK